MVSRSMQGSHALGARVGGICKRFFRFEICEVFFGSGKGSIWNFTIFLFRMWGNWRCWIFVFGWGQKVQSFGQWLPSHLTDLQIYVPSAQGQESLKILKAVTGTKKLLSVPHPFLLNKVGLDSINFSYDYETTPPPTPPLFLILGLSIMQRSGFATVFEGSHSRVQGLRGILGAQARFYILLEDIWGL